MNTKIVLLGAFLAATSISGMANASVKLVASCKIAGAFISVGDGVTDATLDRVKSKKAYLLSNKAFKVVEGLNSSFYSCDNTSSKYLKLDVIIVDLESGKSATHAANCRIVNTNICSD